MISRTLREWQRIGYGDDDTTIPQAEADRIAAVAARSTLAGRGGEGVLEHGRKGLRARGVVGVIVAQGCQLEILPKIESLGEREASDDALRRRLIHMLAVVYDLRIDAGSLAELGRQKDTILEVLIRLFCMRLMEAVRQGLPRRYLEYSDDLPALRGRLNVTRQFSRHAVAPQRLACRYDELSSDIPLNQVMRAAVTRLQHVAKAPDNQRMLRELGFAYADVTKVPVVRLCWDQITLDRTNQLWNNLLSFAKLFLAEQHQQTTAGVSDGHALLFEMSALFEQYVARLAKRALSGSGYSVTSQGGHRDCLFEEGRGRFRTKPDIIVKKGNQAVLVIDTKWKRIASYVEDPKHGISQADVYQMMAYNQIYQCSKVVLLYPSHGGLPAQTLEKTYRIAHPAAGDELTVATFDLTKIDREQIAALKGFLLKILNSAPPRQRPKISKLAIGVS